MNESNPSEPTTLYLTADLTDFLGMAGEWRRGTESFNNWKNDENFAGK